MKNRICICCGESMVEKGNALSRNPNVCASCSSILDGGMDNQASLPELPEDQTLPKASRAREKAKSRLSPLTAV